MVQLAVVVTGLEQRRLLTVATHTSEITAIALRKVTPQCMCIRAADVTTESHHIIAITSDINSEGIERGQQILEGANTHAEVIPASVG